MNFKQYALLLLVGENGKSFAQENKLHTFSSEAIVYGYYFNPSKRKDKNISLEGMLEGVDVTIYHEKNIIYKTKTNSFGEFKFDLPVGKIYRLEVAKKLFESFHFLLVRNEIKNWL